VELKALNNHYYKEGHTPMVSDSKSDVSTDPAMAMWTLKDKAVSCRRQLKKIDDMHSTETLACLQPNKFVYPESRERPNKSHFDSLLK